MNMQNQNISGNDGSSQQGELSGATLEPTGSGVSKRDKSNLVRQAMRTRAVPLVLADEADEMPITTPLPPGPASGLSGDRSTRGAVPRRSRGTNNASAAIDWSEEDLSILKEAFFQTPKTISKSGKKSEQYNWVGIYSAYVASVRADGTAVPVRGKSSIINKSKTMGWDPAFVKVYASKRKRVNIPVERDMRADLIDEESDRSESDERPTADVTVPVTVQQHFDETLRQLMLQEDLPMKPIARLRRKINSAEWAWGSKLSEHAIPGTSLVDIHKVVYAIAKAITAHVDSEWQKHRSGKTSNKPGYMAQLKRQLQTLRGKIGKLTAVLKMRRDKVPLSPKLAACLAKLVKRPEGSRELKNSVIEHHMRNLKNSLKNTAWRLRDLTRLRDIRLMRERFDLQPGKRGLEERIVQKPINPTEAGQYFSKIWGSTSETGSCDVALRNYSAHMSNRMKDVQDDEESICTTEQMAATVKKSKALKAAGPDGIQALWWKVAKSCLARLLEWLNTILNDATGHVEIPGWLTLGRTVLIPKKKDDNTVEAQRPITCLNTSYKLCTGAIVRLIENSAFYKLARDPLQRALNRGHYGCHHALYADVAYMKSAKTSKRDLVVTWIDLRKAFDTVDHTVLRGILKSMKMPIFLQRTIGRLMEQWRTSIEMPNPCRGKPPVKSEQIHYKRGLFQGDTLSPYLFTVALLPLLHEIQRADVGFRTPKISASIQAYVDDMKLYSNTFEGMDKMIDIVKTIGEATGLEMNLSKCAIASTYSVCPVRTDGIRYVKDLPGHTYRYLGFEQSQVSHPTLNRDVMTTDIVDFVAKTAKRGYRSDQMLGVLRTCIASKLGYTYRSGILTHGSGKDYHRFDEDLKLARDTDLKIRNVMRKHGMFSGNQAVARMYLPAHDGGLAIPSLEETFLRETLAASCYMALGPDDMPEIFDIHQSDPGRSVLRDAEGGVAKEIKTNITIEKSGVTIGAETFVTLKSATKACSRSVKAYFHAQRMDAMINHPRAGRKWRDEKDTLKSIGDVCSSRMSLKMLRSVMSLQEESMLLNAHPAFGGKRDPRCRFACNVLERRRHVMGGCGGLRTAEQPKHIKRPNQSAPREDITNRHDIGIMVVVFRQIQRWMKVAQIPNGSLPDDTMWTGADKKTLLYWNPILEPLEFCVHRNPDGVLIIPRLKEVWILEAAVADSTEMKDRADHKYDRYMIGTCHYQDCECRKATEKQQRTMSLAHDFRQKFVGYRVDTMTIVIGSAGETCANTTVDLIDNFERIGIASRQESRLMLLEAANKVACNSARILSRHLARPIEPEQNDLLYPGYPSFGEWQRNKPWSQRDWDDEMEAQRAYAQRERDIADALAEPTTDAEKLWDLNLAEE